MSIINQMLKDLDKRSKSLPHANMSLTGIESVLELNQAKRKKDWLIALAVFLITTGLIAGFPVWFKKSQPAPALYIPIEPVKPAATLAVSAEEVVQNAFSQSGSPAILTGITLQSQHEITFLRFLLNDSVLYRIETNPEKNELIIELEQARLLTNLPEINYANTAVAQITMQNQPNGNLKIIMTLKNGAVLQKLNLGDANKLPELQLDFYYQSPAPAETESQETFPLKTIIVNNSGEDTWQQAQALAAKGQIADSIHLLTTLVNQSPENDAARQLLVTLLLQKRNNALAERITDLGLIRQPTYLPFTELKARILADKGKTAEAVTVLEKLTPPITQYPNYYSFLAALYQQSGKSDLAEKIYQQLLALEPAKGVWWVGLAIAEETLGKHAESLESYTQAENTQNLSPELKAYVETQLHDV